MRYDYLFVALSILTASCSTVTRTPTSEKPLADRNGAQVHIPGLRTALNIPACENERKSLAECIPADEPKLFEEVTKVSFVFQSAQNPASEKVSQRDFHAKQHACLAGVWTPLRGISPKVRTGVFALKNHLPVVVRFSNGSPKSPAGNGLIPPDSKPDARGLGIKLVGVPGESVLSVEDGQPGLMNQDFVLINFPAFFLRTPKSYPQFISLITQGKPFFQILDPVELQVLKDTTRPVADVSSERFFSQTPYLLGNQGVKYRVHPCREDKVAPLSEAESADPNYLRARIASKLEKKPLCYIFSVQVRTEGMDMEDAAVEWKQGEFYDVAKIEIPNNQNFNDPARNAYCENISFNPWNSLPENRPAGAINRARLSVYTAISRKRRQENSVPFREPVATDSFFNVLRN